MTTWDKIYKDYEKGGDAWATLSEGIMPEFLTLLEEHKFLLKKAFDVGCGTGKYLLFLKSKGFDTFGVDSSETAVRIAKGALDSGSSLMLGNMFEHEPEREEYDLVLSISTIHHGFKDEIHKLIERLHGALVPGGIMFITLPDYQSALDRGEFDDSEKLASQTYAPLSGPEKGLPHSFYDKEEIRVLCSRFPSVRITLDEIGRWVVIAEK